MNGADVFDILTEGIGAKGRAIVAIAFFVGIWLFRGETMHLFNWLVMQRAHELTSIVNHAFTQPTAPAVSNTP